MRWCRVCAMAIAITTTSIIRRRGIKMMIKKINIIMTTTTIMQIDIVIIIIIIMHAAYTIVPCVLVCVRSCVCVPERSGVLDVPTERTHR